MAAHVCWLYAAYLAWLLAGLVDFACHRRTDLPHTSGVAESALHLLQLALLGTGFVAVLALRPSASTIALAGVLVALHAMVGYWDTSVAFRRRRVSLPIEQHVHSILDMAPIIAFVALLAYAGHTGLSSGWDLQLRRPALPPSVWLAVLGPPLLLCVLPAALEFRAAWKVRSESAR